MGLMRPVDSLAHVTALDGVVETLAAMVQRLPSRIRDLLHGTWLGHPVHPVLAQVPLGAWVSAAVLDVLATSRPQGAQREGIEAAATTLVGVGLATVPAAAAAGAADWSVLQKEQQRIGLVHAATNVAASTLFAASLAQRLRGRTAQGRALGIGALALASGGAALGSHLAYRWSAGANHAPDLENLLPQGWHDIGPASALPQGRAIRSEVAGTAVAVVRHGDQVIVLADECSHLGGPLSEGEVTTVNGEQCLVCPWHGSAFRLGTGVGPTENSDQNIGTVRRGPATAPQPTFETRIDGDRVLARVSAAPGARRGRRRALGQVV
jgi:nitrite reductase/ring-hydroxylating ferredoxin subunit/uncharacterized membrane protein